MVLVPGNWALAGGPRFVICENLVQFRYRPFNLLDCFRRLVGPFPAHLFFANSELAGFHPLEPVPKAGALALAPLYQVGQGVFASW
jgi:hypothetical protein